MHCRLAYAFLRGSIAAVVWAHAVEIFWLVPGAGGEKEASGGVSEAGIWGISLGRVGGERGGGGLETQILVTELATVD